MGLVAAVAAGLRDENDLNSSLQLLLHLGRYKPASEDRRFI